MCRVYNKCLFLLYVITSVHPRIDSDNSSPSKVTATEGEVTELRCHFSGDPEPEVTWYRGFPNTKGRETSLGLCASVRKYGSQTYESENYRSGLTFFYV